MFDKLLSDILERCLYHTYRADNISCWSISSIKLVIQESKKILQPYIKLRAGSRNQILGALFVQKKFKFCDWSRLCAMFRKMLELLVILGGEPTCTCCKQYIIYNMQYTLCNIQYAKCNMQCNICNTNQITNMKYPNCTFLKLCDTDSIINIWKYTY